MTTYICKCGRRVKKSTDASTTGNRLSGYAPGHECWGCPYAMPYGDFQWDESARTVSRETRGYECRMSKTLTYASEFAGSIKDKCTCRVHSLDFDFLSQVSAWIKDTYPDREIFGSFSKDIRASDYGSDGRYCLTITCTQNLKGVAAKRELLGQFFNPDGSRKDMTPQQEMEKILADIKKAKEILSCAPAQNADAAVTTAENAVPTATAATPTISESGADASASTPATSLQNCESAPAASAGGSSAPMPSAPGFDFGADDETNTLLLQDAQTFITGNMARIMAAKHAHDLTANHYKGSWGKWCAAVGISRDTGDRMVSVAAQCGNIQLEGKSILDVQPLKLLYAAAKSSTPTQVKQAVFSGDITSYKEYQELLAQVKAEKSRADTAEAHLEAAHADINGLTERAQKAESERDKARADQLSTAKDCNRLGLKVSQEKDRADKAEARLKNSCIAEQNAWEAMQKAENARDAALADVQGLTEQNAKLQQSYHDADESRIAANLQRQKAEAERDRAEERAKNAEDALKKQPITAVIDEEEIDRRAAEKAWGLADARNAELAKDNANLKKQVAALRSRINDDAQADFEQANYCASLMRAAWDNSKASYSRLVGEDLESTFQTICGTLNSIMEEASLLCRQPPDYDGGDRDE